MAPRRTNEGVYTLKFWKDHPYTVEGKTLFEQCVWYVMGRIGERLGYPMTNWEKMPSCSPNPAWNHIGVFDAKNWLKDARWQTSQKPMVDSAIVLDGKYGHVAYIEEDFGNGIFGISQYNKNSDRKFHYEKVDLSGNKLYGMKILGYLVVPVNDVKRDETKHQLRVIVDQLRIRKDNSTNSDIVRISNNGELFNFLDEFNDETYRWCLTDDGWIATKSEWIDEYIPVDNSYQRIEELELVIKAKDSEIEELKRKIERKEKHT